MKARQTKPSTRVRFNVKNFNRLVREDHRNWSITYETLRTLCRRYPRHHQPNANYAKLVIIGRAYSAGMERKGIKDLHQLARYIARRHDKIDGLIRSLPKRKTITPQAIRVILRVHKRFVSVLSRFAKTHGSTGANLRSFASKYLHFHHAGVPIFDRLANSALQRHRLDTLTLNTLKSDVPERSCDAQYRQFAIRLFALAEEATNAGCNASVARLDRYLWTLGKKQRK